MSIIRNRFSIIAGALAVSFALPAMAEPPVGGPPVGKESERGQEGFGKDARGKGQERPRAQGQGGERGRGDAWRKSFQSIESSLTDAQKEQVTVIRSDFETQVKTWRDANGAKEKELQEKIRASMAQNKPAGEGAGEGKGEGKGKGEGARGERARVDPALVKEMQDLRATMPKPEDMQKKLWTVLSTEQQAAFKTNMEAMEKAAADKAGERRRGAGAGEGKDAMQGEGGDRPARRPQSGKPFQFEEGKDAPAERNGDGKPSGK